MYVSYQAAALARRWGAGYEITAHPTQSRGDATGTAAASAGYYFLVHPHILDALQWLSENLAFSFVIGYFFGVFTIDVVYSAHLVTRIRQFAKENEVDIKLEQLKAHIRRRQDERREKANFLFAFRSSHSLKSSGCSVLWQGKNSQVLCWVKEYWHSSGFLL